MRSEAMEPLSVKPMRRTVDEVLDLPVPDHFRGYELEHGELVEVTPVSPPHGRIAAKLAHRLMTHVEERCSDDERGSPGPHDGPRVRGACVSSHVCCIV